MRSGFLLNTDGVAYELPDLVKRIIYKTVRPVTSLGNQAVILNK